MRRRLLACVLTLMGAFAAPQAHADAISDFYKSKNVTMVVGFSSGGIYDIWARLIARHLPKHIPGNPSVVIQNMIGAGGLTAVNNLYNSAPQDGTYIGASSNLNPFAPLLGIKEARFDPARFQWLGSPTQDVAIVVLWQTVPVNTFDDLKTREVVLGSTSPDSASSFYGRVISEIFGAKFRFVYGFPGLADTDLAIERGEVDGHPSVFWNHLVAAKPEWLKDKKAKLLLQYGAKPRPELPDVPFAQKLPMSAEHRALLDAAMAPLALGYPYMMGPNVPADRAAAMRTAFADVLADKDFLADAKKQDLEVDPIGAAEMQRIVTTAYAVSPDVKAQLLSLYDVAKK